MATTILPGDLDTTPAETSPTPSRVRSLAALIGWVAVAVALALAALLALRALSSDDDAVPAPWFSVENGSVGAIDHASELQARNQPFVETGSIAALDHATEQQARRPAFPGETGSIAALDHAADGSWFSAEHGSIAAIDHAADDAPAEG